MPSLYQLRFLLPLAGALAGTVACSDSNGLSDPIFGNLVDTVSLGALEGTPVTTPSAFSVAGTLNSARGAPVRSDQTSAFDFAFNFDAADRPVFLPLAVLGLGSRTSSDPGLRRTTTVFADIIAPPSDGYINQDTVHFDVGERFIIRSRVVCSLLGVPQYGKIEVLAIDPVAQTVTFQALTNNNCGYKSLKPGLPAE